MESWRKGLAERSFRLEGCFLLHRFAHGATSSALLKARITTFKQRLVFCTLGIAGDGGVKCPRQSSVLPMPLAGVLRLAATDPYQAGLCFEALQTQPSDGPQTHSHVRVLNIPGNPWWI
jgi:hypothetical protein